MRKFLCITVLFAFCIGLKDVQAQTRKRKITKTTKGTSTRSKKAARQRVPVSNKNMLALLQGRWQSMDDQKSFLVVTGDTQVTYYGTDAIDTSTINFYKDYPVKATPADLKLTGGNYLIAMNKPDDYLIYSVEGITNTRLTLMFLPRGNLLRYKKTQ